MVRWEMGLLDELGFGLDLSKCASTGQGGDLIYVSPKTGRAVSAVAGKPYHDRLFALPAFLGGHAEPTVQDVIAGLKLTGYFLERHVFEPRNMVFPQARAMLEQALVKGVAA
jgi:DNA repair protein RecO (recombination protein O)